MKQFFVNLNEVGGDIYDFTESNFFNYFLFSVT
jgi:serine phosphatase RsbU (regulator of sigma subunit)